LVVVGPKAVKLKKLVSGFCLDGVGRSQWKTTTIKGEKRDHPVSPIVLVVDVVLDSLSLLFQKRVGAEEARDQGLPRWRLLARGQDENDDEDD
jgi:hypothetical protein